MDKLQNVTDIISKVTSDICDNYCKFPEQYTFEEFEKMLCERCNECPLDHLM